MEHEQIIRHSYRIPASELDDISVRVNGREQEIISLSNHGIGIRCRPPEESFEVGALPLDIELRLGDKLLCFTGNVAHITHQDDSDDYLCGIDLVDMDEASREALLAYVARIRAAIFKSE